MTSLTKRLAIFVLPLALAACGGGDPAGDMAASLVDGGCDPAIASAMAPFDSDMGECTMPQFTGLCGAENKSRGIALIAELRNTDRDGQNPWALACAREGDPSAGVRAACEASGMGKPEQCECAADRIAADGKADLRSLARVLANDAPAIAREKGGDVASLDRRLFADRTRFGMMVDACRS